MLRLSARSKDEVIAEIGRSFGITPAMADMHEQVGHLIAYARVNGVVPPWSRGEGKD